MNARLRALTLVLLFSSLTFTYAQKGKLKKYINNGEAYFMDEYYEMALPWFQKADSLQPNDTNITYKIGVCYIHSVHEQWSLPFLLKARDLGTRNKKLNYYIARAEHLNHKFDTAMVYYRKYEASLDQSIPEEKAKYDEMEAYYKQCEYGKKLYHDSLHIKISNLGPDVNTSYPEYVPVISADESVLIFTSRRESTTGSKIDIQDEKYMEDIYVSYKEDNGRWSKPESISDNINTKEHDACIGLSPDGQKLFIYKANKNVLKRSGDIYVSNLEGTEWSEPVKLGANVNTGGWEPSASITADGKTLYFTSDRAGGLGGTDIYVSRLQDNSEWGEAENLGPVINTELDEDAPFIHVDGKTLYFSSRGHENIGGYDIFVSTYDEDNKTWSKPKNIGYPINTADDDIYFVWNAEGTKGFFSSYREDTYGEKDLYSAVRPGEKAHLVVMKGIVRDQDTYEPLAANIVITDNSTTDMVGIYNSNVITGKYTIILPHGKNYNVTVEMDGYLFFSDNVNIPESSHYIEVRKDIFLIPIPDTVVAQVDSTTSDTGTTIQIPSVSMVLKNIFFDYDKSTLRKESLTELNNLFKLLSDYPNMYVEISGHTDSIASHAYNEKLSEERAMAVVQFLANRGIQKERMVAIGYGENKPMFPNTTAENRQKNRRTELKLINKSDIDKYPKHVIDINKWKPTRISRNPGNVQGLYADGKTEPAIGQIMKQKVHFLFNNFDFITDFSKSQLNRLVRIMNKYPDLKLKIHAHADPKGSKTYNSELSQKRAETVLNYLTGKGVNKDRFEIATLSDKFQGDRSSEADKSIENRRVEFEVIK